MKNIYYLIIIILLIINSCKKQDGDNTFQLDKQLDVNSSYYKILGNKKYTTAELNSKQYILWHPSEDEFKNFKFFLKIDYSDDFLFYTRNYLTKEFSNNVIINFFETTFEDNICHTCAPGIGILIEKDGNIYYKKEFLFELSGFGSLDEKSLDIQVFNDDIYLIQSWGYMGQGFVESGKNIYLIDSKKISKVLEIKTSESNGGLYNEDDERYWGYNSTFNYKEDNISGYLIFEEIKKGTILDDNKKIEINEINIYKYNKDQNKYIKIE